MTSGNDRLSFSIRKAKLTDLVGVKHIADGHKAELGFVLRPALEKAILDGEVFVAVHKKNIIGFVHYHHRRDEQTTLYHIAVDRSYRSYGVGQALINALVQEATRLNKQFILLKCPGELAANQFYKNEGFTLLRTENGKHRALNVWTLPTAAE